MCGVFGIVGGFNASKACEALSVLSHRGRDHCGIVEQEGLFFAHQRLSIVDTHERSHQPIRRDKRLLSFNGEIYNHNQLRHELGDCDWRTVSDAEVVLAAYERWGIECVQRFEGMFAFALIDGDKLYLVRDRFGKKPLFYMQTQEAFIFASEIKALKPFLATTKMNEEAMMSYLSFLAPTPPHTFYEGIKKVQSGAWLCYQNREIITHQYYDLLDTPALQITTQANALESIEQEFYRSMQMRMECDAPMAALLSGGIDSAMICAVALRQGKKLPTYTLGYEGHGSYDERKNARYTAEYLGLEHSEVVMSQNDFDTHLDPYLWQMDEPLNDPAGLPLYLLFQQIAEDGYKVVLSGEGSDELFLGYRQYFEYLDIEKAASLMHKNWLKKYFHAHFSMNREWEWYKRVFDETLLFRTSGEKFTDLQLNKLMRRNVRDNESMRFLEAYRKRFEASRHSDPAQWYTAIDLKLFVGEHFLTKLDRVSMAHTIEARSPFLDHILAEKVFSIDPAVRKGSGGTKPLLKEVAKRYLDETIIGRKKKGFSNPYMEWLIATGRIDLIKEVNEQTGMFHPEILDRYIQTAHTGKFKQHVWGLYVLSHWIKQELL